MHCRRALGKVRKTSHVSCVAGFLDEIVGTAMGIDISIFILSFPGRQRRNRAEHVQQCFQILGFTLMV